MRSALLTDTFPRATLDQSPKDFADEITPVVTTQYLQDKSIQYFLFFHFLVNKKTSNWGRTKLGISMTHTCKN